MSEENRGRRGGGSEDTVNMTCRYNGGPPRGFGDSGRRGIYFQGFGEKGHLFSGIWGESRVLGSREQGAEEKHFRELGRKVAFLSGSREQRPPPPGGAS